ncbi:hypothetical protein D9M73_90620 [compost metagenome]
MNTPALIKPMTAAERDLHIQDCTKHFMEAYARFEDHGLPADRDAALQWLHIRDQAVRERLLDEGLDFFQVQGARHAAEAQEALAHA